MWDEQDEIGYKQCKLQNIGQISNDEFSKDIQKYATNDKYTTFLEIGTWNGLGSTMSFADGFKHRTDNYIFYSLECNRDKWYDALQLYNYNDKMHILNDVIWNEIPEDFYKIFPQCKSNAMYKHWNEIDIKNMKQCKLFLNRPNVPDIFDVILLDGGEFTTYHEFQILKKKCKILMLDDTNTNKCVLIVDELIRDPNWKILKKSNTRNGYLIAENILYK